MLTRARLVTDISYVTSRSGFFTEEVVIICWTTTVILSPMKWLNFSRERAYLLTLRICLPKSCQREFHYHVVHVIRTTRKQPHVRLRLILLSQLYFLPRPLGQQIRGMLDQAANSATATPVGADPSREFGENPSSPLSNSYPPSHRSSSRPYTPDLD